ncbi:acetylgalactosaminyl-O-glycosyl-glycoprotein beta-1,3-N-acetylglucosaminyltransferase-like [Ruditapes philippinarum]|uniref:acetylgalactosaminyl-O-glycosyl-glycoprotein beta-1,3-N-acetylglucosaminyltransferase-like n=1 Tax=Ruditapes philippinarum TaxID=129788 RepID=UPI00295B7DA1|nr:acetylgalactosaminyl-O-glycosyl-glycoprotein beta-1,3-N-acetylglucosaminyltransferase-like [Ruditapes philippinarum]
MILSGIGKVEYGMNKSEMAVCLRLFEKEWRNGPKDGTDIKHDANNGEQDYRELPEMSKDKPKRTDTSKDVQKSIDCSVCNNMKDSERKDNSDGITKTDNKPKNTPKETKISDKKADVSLKTEHQENQQNEKKEQNKKDKSDLSNIRLNPKTAKSLKPNVTSHLNNILHRTMQKPYLIENPKLCSSVKGLKVLVIVHSATKHFEKRLVMRETWTNNSYYPNLGPIRTMFLLGRAPTPYVKASINQEFKQYGDILQGDFVDSYHNLTLKGVTAYKWVTEKCRNAQVILKIDDDVIINMFHFLTQTVPFIVSKPKHIACRRSGMARVNRNPNNKWFVAKELFVGEKTYPEYCEGFMVAFSNDLLPSLFKSAMLTPFFWIDDVYLYGLVPRNIPGVHYTNLTFENDVLWGIDKIKECLKKETKCNHFVFLLLKHSSLKVRSMWALVLNQKTKRN